MLFYYTNLAVYNPSFRWHIPTPNALLFKPLPAADTYAHSRGYNSLRSLYHMLTHMISLRLIPMRIRADIIRSAHYIISHTILKPSKFYNSMLSYIYCYILLKLPHKSITKISKYLNALRNINLFPLLLLLLNICL